MGNLTGTSPSSPSGSTQATVLLVDDDASLLRVAGSMLLAEGYRVMRAGTPEEAVRVFERMPGEIDLLLSDVQMHGMSGPELGTRLRHVRPDLPVIFMTGHPTQVAVLGDVLEKPFGMRELCGRVAAALDIPASQGLDLGKAG